MAESGLAGSAQSALSADPKYQQLLAQFNKTRAPLDWAALTQYSLNDPKSPTAGLNFGSQGRFNYSIGGSGQVTENDPNNPWTSPGTWGPVIVGAAAAPFALGYGAASAGASGGTAASAAGGTAAGAGAGATGAGMAGFLTPIISSGISGGMQYAGGKAQAKAETQASQLQNQFNEKALAAAVDQQNWQRQQYANYVQRMQPYNQIGLNAGASLSGLLARNPYGVYAHTGQAPTPQTFPLPASSVGSLATK